MANSGGSENNSAASLCRAAPVSSTRDRQLTLSAYHPNAMANPRVGADPRAPRVASRAVARTPPGILSLLLLGATLWAGALSAEVSTEGATGPVGPAVPEQSTPPPPAALPVAQIAPRATEVAQYLRGVEGSLVPGAAIERIQRSLPLVSAELSQTRIHTLSVLEQQPSLETLQAQEQHWQRRQHELGAWLAIATDRATRLQGDLERLDAERGIWTLTRDAARSAAAPVPLLQQIDDVLAAIASCQPLTQAERDRALELQARIAQEVGHCERVRARIARLEQAVVGGILAREGGPIWSPEPWAQAQGSVSARLSQILAAYWADVRLYVSDPAKHMPIHLGVFLLALFALVAARARVDRWAGQGEQVARLVPVFDRPVAAALLVALALATSFFSPAPFSVKELLDALALAPMILLARPVIGPAFVPALYALGVLFALDTLRHAFGGIPPLIGQSIILVQTLVGLWVLLPLLRGSRAGDGGPSHQTLRRLLIGLILALLAAGLVASLLGYLRLARLTAPAVLSGRPLRSGSMRWWRSGRPSWSFAYAPGP